MMILLLEAVGCKHNRPPAHIQPHFLFFLSSLFTVLCLPSSRADFLAVTFPLFTSFLSSPQCPAQLTETCGTKRGSPIVSGEAAGKVVWPGASCQGQERGESGALLTTLACPTVKALSNSSPVAETSGPAPWPTSSAKNQERAMQPANSH